MKKTVLLLFASVVLFASSCVKEHEPLPIVPDTYYFTDIVKIFEKNGCISCHSSAGTYDYVMSNWVDKSVDPESTVLYTAIKDGGAMNQYINTADVTAVLEWIKSGALEGEPIIDTTPLPPVPKDSSYYTMTIYPILKGTCIGCHHDDADVLYNSLFVTNTTGAIWIEDKANVASSLVYEKLTTGSMSSYLVDPDRTTVLNWLLDGANKSQYSYAIDVMPMFSTNMPLLDKNCSSCHNVDYTSVMTSWVSTTVPAKSTVLYNNIKPGGAMSEYLPADSVTTVLNWIREGASE